MSNATRTEYRAYEVNGKVQGTGTNPTCPPSRHLDPPGASDPKNRAAVAAESCLPTNSSAAEIVKSVGAGADFDFSQNRSLPISPEFGKLNPEASAAGLTTGEPHIPSQGASTRRTTVNERFQELLTGCHTAPEATSRPSLSVFGILDPRGDAMSRKNHRSPMGFQVGLVYKTDQTTFVASRAGLVEQRAPDSNVWLNKSNQEKLREHARAVAREWNGGKPVTVDSFVDIDD